MKDLYGRAALVGSITFFYFGTEQQGLGAVKNINHYKTPISHIISLRLKADQQQQSSKSSLLSSTSGFDLDNTGAKSLASLEGSELIILL